MTAPFASSVCDMRAVPAFCYGVNHRASISKASRVCFGIINVLKLRARALCAATAHCGKSVSGGEAKLLVQSLFCFFHGVTYFACVALFGEGAASNPLKQEKKIHA